jgi:glutamate/tyrosine decarboxylase-like PLP-dependent enzyme
MKIPETGLDRAELFRRLEAYRADDMPWRAGRTWAYVYDPGPEADEVIKQAFALFLTENALDPPSSRARCGSRTISWPWPPRTCAAMPRCVGTSPAAGRRASSSP